MYGFRVVKKGAPPLGCGLSASRALAGNITVIHNLPGHSHTGREDSISGTLRKISPGGPVVSTFWCWGWSFEAGGGQPQTHASRLRERSIQDWEPPKVGSIIQYL